MLAPREVIFVDTVELDSGRTLIDRITKLHIENPKAPIRLYIVSEGGLARVAQAFFALIRVKQIKLETIALGFVDSAALMLYAAGTKRVATDLASFYFHRPRKTYDREKMSITDVERELDQGRIVENESDRILSDACGCSVNSIQQLRRNNRTLSAKEAKKLGLVHEIIDL